MVGPQSLSAWLAGIGHRLSSCSLRFRCTRSRCRWSGCKNTLLCTGSRICPSLCSLRRLRTHSFAWCLRRSVICFPLLGPESHLLSSLWSKGNRCSCSQLCEFLEQICALFGGILPLIFLRAVLDESSGILEARYGLLIRKGMNHACFASSQYSM